ncbi:PLD nuclease N-terminal domain-containing protein [Flavobacterium psychraquaticum]|uniref:PLD nuclease N-terminal domain-containing protein n=1 Tax=Flavobacterium psychraquaticum TaxID=3103958 RepID=UPI002ACD2781|nr:PLD nuclease N-terminal domain-containing protein [Flavobacterium sp. LB-N7T]
METVISEFSVGLFVWQFLMLLTFGLWVFCLIDILKSNFEGNDKLIWTLVILFLPVLGALLYFVIGRKKRLIKE